jgi:hypothetical protein
MSAGALQVEHVTSELDELSERAARAYAAIADYEHRARECSCPAGASDELGCAFDVVY